MFTSLRGLSNAREHVEDVVCEFGVGPVFPVASNGAGEISDARPATAGAVVGERHVLEAVVVTDANGALEVVRIGEADRPSVPYNSNVRDGSSDP